MPSNQPLTRAPCLHEWRHEQVSPASGQLAARSSTVVAVDLSGAVEKELIDLIKLEVCDWGLVGLGHQPLCMQVLNSRLSSSRCKPGCVCVLSANTHCLSQHRILCKTPEHLRQVLDVEEGMGVAQCIPIGLRGELYKIQVAVKYPQVRKALPYGMHLCMHRACCAIKCGLRS